MNRILLTLLIAFTYINSYAQQGFHVGFSGSFNTVWIINQNAYGLDEYQYKLKLGGGGGLDLGYNFTDHLGLQSGISFSSQGQKYHDSHNTNNTRDYSLSYTCIPILFKYTGGNSNVKFYAMAGPRFSFLNTVTLTYSDGTNTTTINGKERYTNDDAGIMFGLGTNIGVTKNIYINAGMNFFYSFSDINSTNPAPGSPTGNWRWPWHTTGLYSPSSNATGGINAGIHYLVPTGKHHR